MNKRKIFLTLGFIVVVATTVFTFSKGSKADESEYLGERVDVYASVVAEPIPEEEIVIEPIIEEDTTYILVEMPERSRDFKSYMSYTCLKNWLQADLQEIATTDEDGFRKLDDRYMIAVGTAVTNEVGTYVTLVLENGTEIKCIVGDIKDDMHTQDNNIVTKANECVSEFIIDKDVMDDTVLSMGSVSYAFENWRSKVVSIKVEDKNYFN